MRKFAGLLLVLCSSTLLAQNTPPPPGTPPLPITAYTGRYLDSGQTLPFNRPFVWRARKTIVLPSLDRFYFMNAEGQRGGIGVYQLSTFPQTLQAPYIVTAGGALIRPPLAVIGADWGVEYDAEFLNDFDVDDRGYVYVATALGLRIADSEGRLVSETNVSMGRVFVVRAGPAYYVVSRAGSSTTVVYDTTNPASPRLVRTVELPEPVAVSVDDSRVLVRVTGAVCPELRVYETASYVTGGAPLAVMVPPAPCANVTAATADNTNFYAILSSLVGNAFEYRVIRLAPSGGGYTLTQVSVPPAARPQLIAAGAGYVAVTGNVRGAGPSLLLVRFDTPTPTVHDLTSFTSNAYGLVGGAATPVTIGGRTYLILPFHYVGEVFELLPVGQPIPTLSEWTLLALAAALTVAAAMRLRG